MDFVSEIYFNSFMFFNECLPGGKEGIPSLGIRASAIDSNRGTGAWSGFDTLTNWKKVKHDKI